MAWAEDYGGTTGYAWDTQQSPNVRLVAAYEYDPYGNITAQSGAYAGNNPFRFSTKYYDTQTGLGYWGYRYYSPGLGRWISRDPIAEAGDLNMCVFVKNDPLAYMDALGLKRSDYKPTNADRCGFWIICPAERDMRLHSLAEAYAQKGLPIEAVPGFEVQFFPDLTAEVKKSEDWGKMVKAYRGKGRGKSCCCKCDDQSPGNIRVVQVVYTPDRDPHEKVDSGDAKAAKLDYPWGYVEGGGMAGQGPHSHFDAPNFGYAGAKHLFEACAVCRHDGKDEVLGCATWSFFDGVRGGAGRGLTGFKPEDEFSFRGRKCYLKPSDYATGRYYNGIHYWQKDDPNK